MLCYKHLYYHIDIGGGWTRLTKRQTLNHPQSLFLSGPLIRNNVAVFTEMPDNYWCPLTIESNKTEQNSEDGLIVDWYINLWPDTQHIVLTLSFIVSHLIEFINFQARVHISYTHNMWTIPGTNVRVLKLKMQWTLNLINCIVKYNLLIWQCYHLYLISIYHVYYCMQYKLILQWTQ